MPSVIVNVFADGCGPDGGPGPILQAIAELRTLIVNDQQKLDALATHLNQIGDQIGTGVTDLTAAIAALKTQPAGTPLDWSAVDAAINKVQGGSDNLTQLDTANPPPVPPTPPQS